jgi:general secretion pathway protein A
MQRAAFGLNKQPFSMTPEPDMLYLTASSREALAGLTYAIMRQKGFIVLSGEVGTGKTTLLARVLQHLPEDRARCSLIVNPKLTNGEFLEMALTGWGLRDLPESKAKRLLLLRDILLSARAEGRIVVLIVDEAHALSSALLEEIRLLGNFEEPGQKLLQIVLVGQSELSDLLNREDLRQIKQRIAVRLKIERLSGPEVGEYISHRWAKAGGKEPPFSHEAVLEIARSSRGIPRLINAICDNALTTIGAAGVASVEVEHIREVCAELDIAPVPVAAVPPVPDSPAPAALTTMFARKASPGAADFEWPLTSLERYAPPKPKRFFARLVEKLSA